MPTNATDGAHIFVARPRVGVRINLHVVDVCNVAIQYDVLAAMTNDELMLIADAVAAERARRERVEHG